MNNYKVLNPKEYLKDLEQELKKAKSRLFMQAMYFLPPAKTTYKIANILKKAAKKNLDTRIQFDYISLMDTEPNATFMAKFLIKDDPTPLEPKKRHKLKMDLIKELKKHKVKVKLLNKPKGIYRYIPLSKRNHIKLNIVDNIAYVGGLNYGIKDFKNIDFMVRLTNKKLVQKLANIYIRIWNNNLKKDKVFIINKKVNIWLDAGKFNKSIILNNTIKELKKAKKNIFYTGQFPPDGAYLKELVKANKRGIKIKVIIPKRKHKEIVTRILDYLSKKYLYFRGKNFIIKKKKKVVNEKITLIVNKIAIFGSHNYSKSGVLLGTAELTLKINNKSLVKNIKNFFKNF